MVMGEACGQPAVVLRTPGPGADVLARSTSAATARVRHKCMNTEFATVGLQLHCDVRYIITVHACRA